MRLAVIAAGIVFASASIVSASSLNATSAEPNAPIRLAQTQQQKNPQPEQKNQQDQKAKQNQTQQKTMPQQNAQKNETMTQKVKRTWRNWTSPSHTFCVRSPIPVPLTSKTCTAKGKTVEEARAVCIQQNPLSYVSQGKC